MTKKASAWCGIDVSDKTFDAALVINHKFSEFEKVSSAPFNGTKAGVAKFFLWLSDMLKGLRVSPAQVGIVMEATGRMSLELYALLHSDGHEWHTVAIVNPRQIKSYIDSLARRNKTDSQDAKAIAFFGREREPIGYEVREPAYQRLRELVRFRKTCVNQKTALNSRRESVTEPFIRKEIKKQLNLLEKTISNCEKEISDTIRQDAQLIQDFETLTSMVGVGKVTAWTVLGELGDLRRYKKSRQLSAMAGLSPSNRQSGTSVWSPPRMSKQGGAMVREVLYMAAMSAARSNKTSSFKDTYEDLVGRGKAPKSALGAVMRKMLVTMRAMIVSGTSFNMTINRKPVDKRLTSCGKASSSC